ncbi:hypothetical protein L7F22_051477 [Adiantum nelumboides]|nr:hypothetical protein [Adiantum nelumboides]
MGYLDAQAGDAERTAFRRAEKRYKFYKHSSTSARSTKHRESVPPTDLSEVLDFREIRCTELTKESGIKRVDNEELQWPVFTMEKHPGFYFIPEALGVKEQVHWIKESLTTFPQPPNRTNHTAAYGPIFDLWSRAQSGEMIEQPIAKINNYTPALHHNHTSHPIVTLQALNEMAWASVEVAVSEGKSNVGNPKDDRSIDGKYSVANAKIDLAKENSHSILIPMKSLLHKLRWATLGLQFDWSKRAYDLKLPYNRIPQDLYELASKLAKPAMNDSQFHAEAAIVNYFGCDDMLGGHLDDMEKDWNGQSEEENSTFLDLLKCYVSEHKATWEHYLPLVEYAYNNTVHTSTGKVPFEIVEGGKKVPPILQTKDKIFEADKYVQNTDEAYRKIKLALEKTQSKQKKAADRHRRELIFSLGDSVLLRFEKARLRKMKGKERLFPKLGMRYYGPFQVCDKISNVAYR